MNTQTFHQMQFSVPTEAYFSDYKPVVCIIRNLQLVSRNYYLHICK